MKKSVIAVAGLALAAGTASANVYTFDLTGVVNPGTGLSLPFMIADAGQEVVSIDYVIGYTAGDAVNNASWTAEMRLQVTAPGGTRDDVFDGIGGADGDADGSFVMGGPSDAFDATPGGDIMFNWATTNTGFDAAAGNSTLLSGMVATGAWELFIIDTFDDTGDDGIFSDSSIIVTTRAIPAPASMALLGLGGLVAGRRRR